MAEFNVCQDCGNRVRKWAKLCPLCGASVKKEFLMEGLNVDCNLYRESLKQENFGWGTVLSLFLLVIIFLMKVFD